MSTHAVPEVALDGRESAREAVERLVDAHGGQLLALGTRFCGNREDAEDLVQETFLRAYDKWSQFRGAARPSTWLYTIAARVCRRKRRRRAHEPRRIESLDALSSFAEPIMATPPDDEATVAAARDASLEDVQAAIVALPESFRMPFVLQEIAGLAPAQVAQVTGLAPATVRTRVHRARLKVRDAVARHLPRQRTPPAAFSKTVCLDLLRAKQHALDHGREFRMPQGMVCERCSAFFATLDLAEEACRELASGKLPPRLRRELLARLPSS